LATRNDGRFVWYENLTRDVPGAIAFYSEVVGWKTQAFDKNSAYTMWVSGQGPLGGVMAMGKEMGQTPPHWMAHVQVADVDAVAAAVKRLGGKVHHGPEDIPDVGRFAVIGDPQGAVLSLFRPGQGDMERHDMAGDGEFCWNELMTRDGAAACRFYGELLGWKVLDEMDMGPMGKYRIFGIGDERLGGVMDLPKGVPSPCWIYYVNVLDLDAAIARATKRGGKVMNGPTDIPGGGRIAQLADAQGAAFALHRAPPGKG
jgi:uncharacterized protein